MAKTTIFKFHFGHLFDIGWFTVITLVITFCIIEMFDTIGTLIGVSTKAGMLDKDGKLPRIKGALMADAVATTVGAVLGTSTTTTFVESASGVTEGGRTGLTAVTSAPYFKSVLTFIYATFPPPATVHFLPRIFSIIGNISFPPTILQPQPRSRL